MTIRVRHVRFRPTKAGALIHGTRDVAPDDFDLSQHMNRAVWLTSALEAPKWGTVQSYDGAGMSGGLLHNIAVAPRSMEQSSFFALLRQIEVATSPFGLPPRRIELVWERLSREGYFVAQDGKLRHINTGRLVSGRAIRDMFTPPNGNVPKRGPKWEQAKGWATLFHQLLGDRITYEAQIGFAATWMAEGRSLLERTVYQQDGAAEDSPIGIPADALPPKTDLAMAVYHSFSVNGPRPAARALQSSLRQKRWAKTLMRKLARSRHGVWKEKRYPHTRRAVLKGVKLGLWPAELVREIMPAKP